LKVAFFDAKPYDIPGFKKSIENKGITIKVIVKYFAHRTTY